MQTEDMKDGLHGSPSADEPHLRKVKMSVETQVTPERITLLLNGWWDFQPADAGDPAAPHCPTAVPTDGWQDAAYLVPGFFTDHPYPVAWRAQRCGWARTRIVLDRLPAGQSAFLTVAGAIPQAHLFVNGQAVAVQEDMFIGEAIDITEALHAGENELAVYLTPFPAFPHPQSGEMSLIDVPWGCCIAHEQAGIWQDVTLEWRSVVHLDEITIRPSVREGTLTVITRLRNMGATPFTGTLQHTVEAEGVDVLPLPAAEMTVAAGSTLTVTQCVPWTDYRPWSQHDPYLYHLRSEVQGTAEPDGLRTRFGFREVWIEGHRLLLNGVPQRWAGEWCHKAHSHWLRPEYVRQWFGQLKDLHMNYVRMHTFPHPAYFLDIADEMGLLVCQESALFGSSQRGWDTSALWTRAAEHVRRMVRRDNNHPSLVLWSVENEMRWALNLMPSAKEELPKLRALFNELDPTRAAYHEGDSAIWDEDAQPMISRHYGPACHGWGWWDRRVPLHAGEIGRWHYASPYIALQWAGDEVFASYAALSQSMAHDAARIAELGRANEVSCLFVWNTSGLDNFRPADTRAFTWDEPNSRYLKPLAHRTHESEYAWWQEGAGYRPGHSFDILKQAFRPVAIVIYEERTQAYTDRDIPHNAYVVNDLPQANAGELSVVLEQAGRILWQQVCPFSVPAGGTGQQAWRVPLTGAHDGEVVIVTAFRYAGGEDAVRRTLRVSSPQARTEPLELPSIAIWGDSALQPWFAGHDLTVIPIDESCTLDPTDTPLLIIAEHAVEPGSMLNQRVQAFLQEGGRVLVLEQHHSLFPSLSIARMPIEMAHVRDAGHPVTAGISGDVLRFFGDDPFGLPSSDAWVTTFPYVKPIDDTVVRPIIDSSGGDFGTGGLSWAPVIEAQIGHGTLIASQLRLTDRWQELPVAERLLRNTLQYLADYRPPKEIALASELRAGMPATLPVAEDGRLRMIAGACVPAEPVKAMQARLAAGETIVVWGLCPETQPYWEEVVDGAIELWAPSHPVYQLIAPAPTPLLGGISNEDTCWLDNWSYRSQNKKTVIVDHLLDIEGGTMHLQNATHSGLDVLYGHEQATEWKRMPALSAYFDGPSPQVGGGLVEVPVGAGRVLFCQLRWEPELWQFRRFLGLLLWNLGLPVATDILAGESTPGVAAQSDGTPKQVLLSAGVDEAKLAEVISASKRRVEYCSENMLFRQWAGWVVTDTPEGSLASTGGCRLIGLQVHTAEPRKFMQTVGGLPNPDLQTFLRVEGNGTLRAWINGAHWGDYTLTPEKATYIADIDFEAGTNYVVLVWQAEGEASFSLRFENKDRRPETTFMFVG